MDFIEKVKLANSIAGTYEEFSPRKTALYTGLILEELAEQIEAYNCAGLGNLLVALKYHSGLFKAGRFDVDAASVDRLGYLDSAIDLAVVSIGAGISVGADVSGAAENVCSSNLSKFPLIDGKPTAILDENGKWVKASTYKAPELKQFLK